MFPVLMGLQLAYIYFVLKLRYEHVAFSLGRAHCAVQAEGYFVDGMLLEGSFDVQLRWALEMK